MLDIFKRLDLAFVGEGWDNCYIKFRALTVKEMQKIADLKDMEDPMKATEHTLQLLSELFVEGKGISEGKEIDLTKDHLNELPVDVLTKAVNLFTQASEEDKKK